MGDHPVSLDRRVIGGHIWRYRYDKFGWTTRSSQLYESRLLRLGSPLFHFGILLVILGHVGGILIPESATNAVGISETAYHAAAVTLGTISGVMTLSGIAILIYRRRTTGPVFSATTKNDKFMYVVLVAALVAGLATTVLGNITGHPHDYRLTVAPYFRSIFYFHPDVDLITAAPIGFQIHVMLAWVLFAIWPFTRLVHVFSAPLGYLHPPLHRVPVPRGRRGASGSPRMGTGHGSGHAEPDSRREAPRAQLTRTTGGSGTCRRWRPAWCTAAPVRSWRSDG